MGRLAIALLLALLAVVPAEGQQKQFIDTAAQCQELGGHWEPEPEGWSWYRHQCIVHTEPKSCARIGGYWRLNEPAGSLDMICMLPHSKTGELSMCTDRGGIWLEQHQMCAPRAESEACQVKGGQLQPIGGMVRTKAGLYCEVPAPDAGKACQNSGECAYGCQLEGQPDSEGRRPGKCKRSNKFQGCTVHVRDGKPISQVCI